MKLPKYIKNCIDTLTAAGYEAYAVGGAVRDSLLGLEPSDWDVTTGATPNKILEVFSDRRTIPTGIKHGTVTVIFEDGEGKHPVEITTFRVDGEYRDARHPNGVSFASRISDDLSRRDFTVNAMAYNEKEGLVDLFGGREDLKNGILRTVGEPKKRFCEDALRILRAFRFCAQLDFKFEEKTLEGALECAPLLKNISRERVGAEFKRLLVGRGAEYSVGILADSECPAIWSAVFDASLPSRLAVSGLGRVSHEAGFEPRLAVLISHLSPSERERTAASLRLSNDEKRRVLRFCRVHDFEIDMRTDTAILARKFIHLYNDVLPTALELLSVWHTDGELEELVGFVDRERGKSAAFSDLAIGGEDVRALCGAESRLVGDILRALGEAVIADPELNRREFLIALAQKMLEERKNG